MISTSLCVVFILTLVAAEGEFVLWLKSCSLYCSVCNSTVCLSATPLLKLLTSIPLCVERTSG